MVSRKVMTTAAAHSHHSRRSIRRKFARRGALCASPILPTVFALPSRNHHPLVWPFSLRLRLGLPAIGEFVAESMASENTAAREDRKSTRLNSSHQIISYAVFCLKQ